MEDNEMVAGIISRGDESEKIKTYVSFCEIYSEIMGLMRYNKGKAQAEALKLARKMTQIGFKLMVLAPDDVVHSFLKYQAIAGEGGDAITTVTAYGQVLLEIRKDMVPETTVDIETVMDVFPLEG